MSVERYTQLLESTADLLTETHTVRRPIIGQRSSRPETADTRLGRVTALRKAGITCAEPSPIRNIQSKMNMFDKFNRRK